MSLGTLILIIFSVINAINMTYKYGQELVAFEMMNI